MSFTVNLTLRGFGKIVEFITDIGDHMDHGALWAINYAVLIEEDLLLLRAAALNLHN